VAETSFHSFQMAPVVYNLCNEQTQKTGQRK